MRLVAPQSDGTAFGLRADNIMCLSRYHCIWGDRLYERLCKLLCKVVASVIDTALSLFEVELSVVVVGLDAVVVAPLQIGLSVFTAECELAPSYLSFLLELNEFFDCIVSVITEDNSKGNTKHYSHG